MTLQEYYSLAVPITLLGLALFLFFANQKAKLKIESNQTPAEVNRARIKAEKLRKHLKNYPQKN